MPTFLLATFLAVLFVSHVVDADIRFTDHVYGLIVLPLSGFLYFQGIFVEDAVTIAIFIIFIIGIGIGIGIRTFISIVVTAITIVDIEVSVIIFIEIVIAIVILRVIIWNEIRKVIRIAIIGIGITIIIVIIVVAAFVDSLIATFCFAL